MYAIRSYYEKKSQGQHHPLYEKMLQSLSAGLDADNFVLGDVSFGNLPIVPAMILKNNPDFYIVTDYQGGFIRNNFV